MSEEKTSAVYEIMFDALEDVSVERDRSTVTSVNRKRFSVKTCFICLTYDGGKQLKLPVNDDIYTDEWAEKLKKTSR